MSVFAPEFATPPSLRTLKQLARQHARAYGHTLGRFASSEPEHGEPYALARCQACLIACAVVSPTRYQPGRYGGGAALREACPTPFPPDQPTEELDEEDDIHFLDTSVQDPCALGFE